MKTAVINAFLGLAALMLAACGTPEKTTDPSTGAGGLLGGAAEAAGFGNGAEVAKLMEFHRLCLSIVSEVYIGCIAHGSLAF
jgi:hypothetical protein